MIVDLDLKHERLTYTKVKGAILDHSFAPLNNLIHSLACDILIFRGYDA